MKPIRLLLLLVCFCPLAVYAQTAEVGGAVQDPSGAVIPKASVEFRNQDTGIRRQATTNGNGHYQIEAIDPGKYDATVQASGFKTLTRENVVFQVGGKAQIDFKMEVGQSSQSVTVDGSGLQIDVTDGSVSTVVDRNFVQNTPLNGRSFQPLILLTPGVVTNSPQSTGTSGLTGEFSVNGQRTAANVYTVDGVSANTGAYLYGYGTPGTSGSLPAATALGTTQSLVSVDALQEFRVASSSYSAEYGSSPGGQFSFTTRSGTNEAHGTAFDYLRNNYFDANDWFNDNLGTPITALRQNDFGGTLGGPIWFPRLYDGRNKSFFFFSYEGLRLTQPQAAQTLYVPSTDLRTQAPAVLQPVLNAYPLPTGPALSNGLAPFVQTASLPSSLDSTSVRFDQQIGPKVKVFYRFSDSQSAKSTLNLSVLTSIFQSSYTNTLGITAELKPQTVNEFRFNYTANNGGAVAAIGNYGGATPVSLLNLQGIDRNNNPRAQAAFLLRFPGYSEPLQESNVAQPQDAWDLNDSITFVYRNHTLKIGADHREIKSTLLQATPNITTSFSSSQSVLNNAPSSQSVSIAAASYPKFTNTAIYAQDEFKASQRLNISFGVRWELDPPPSQTSGTLPYIVVGDLSNPSTLTLAPAGTAFWKSTYFNLAPRLGLAYRAHTDTERETVIRAGGGVFFDSGQQGAISAFGDSPGQSAFAAYSNVTYPLTPNQINVTISNPPVAPYTSSDAYYFPARLQLPYTLQWNLAVEQSLNKNQSITLTYLGSEGRRLLAQQALSGASVAPNFSYIYLQTTGTTSNYNALQLKYQRTISRGLQVLGSYNWSHSIDFGSQNIAYSQIRGDSDFDLRHNFNIAATYDIATGRSSGLLHSLVDRWGLDTRFSARTAFPITLNGNSIVQPNGQNAYSGLNLIPGAPIYINVAGIAGNRRINPAAFALPASGQRGNAPRNFVRGFGTNQLDLAMRRTFPIREAINLQFRAETFNILNHPNFGYIQPTYGNVQFGEATKMLNQSLGNLSPLYQQGGPRSMQFELKLAF